MPHDSARRCSSCANSSTGAGMVRGNSKDLTVPPEGGLDSGPVGDEFADPGVAAELRQ